MYVSTGALTHGTDAGRFSPPSGHTDFSRDTKSYLSQFNHVFCRFRLCKHGQTPFPDLYHGNWLKLTSSQRAPTSLSGHRIHLIGAFSPARHPPHAFLSGISPVLRSSSSPPSSQPPQSSPPSHDSLSRAPFITLTTFLHLYPPSRQDIPLT